MREFLRKDRCALLNGASWDSKSETATAPGWVADPEIASLPVSSLELRRAAEPHQVSGVLIQSDTPTTPTLAVGLSVCALTQGQTADKLAAQTGRVCAVSTFP